MQGFASIFVFLTVLLLSSGFTNGHVQVFKTSETFDEWKLSGQPLPRRESVEAEVVVDGQPQTSWTLERPSLASSAQSLLGRDPLLSDDILSKILEMLRPMGMRKRLHDLFVEEAEASSFIVESRFPYVVSSFSMYSPETNEIVVEGTTFSLSL
jgi:hypothetical protein